jgi:aminoacyl-tRNA hydrolase
MSTAARPPRRSAFRRLSHRLHLWKVRHAAAEAWESVCYAAGTCFWPRVAPWYRASLKRTTFIAVTGSCGKTTTRMLIEAAVGASRSPKVRRGANQPVDNAQALWTTPRSSRYAVFEAGVGKHGQYGVVKRSAALIRPHVAVVTNIGDDHISSFGSREAIAREKGDLVEALPPDGIAVLNADDALVLGMRARCAGRVITFGVDASADLRAEHVRAAWPRRLSFTAVHAGGRTHVETQLCGGHWVSATLAALAASVAAGVPLEAAAARLRDTPPFFGRMEPLTRSDGVTFVRDDIKAPLWTMPATLEFLRSSAANRKILVVGTISDYTGESRRVYVSVARKALATADHVIFVGPNASRALRARRGDRDDALHAFNTLDAAHAYLSRLVAPGDLIVLKGSQNDLLYQLALERSPGAAACDPMSVAQETPLSAGRDHAIVGMGNPDTRYTGTRHNVGRACVDRLAVRLSAVWNSQGGDLLASVCYAGTTLHLVKLGVTMNDIGPALKRVCARLNVAPERCILVHDDVDLAVGRVRGRIEGGGGGHRGVRSVLETFESNAFPRVKLGVGRPPEGITLAEHVLEPIPDDLRESIAAALEAGCDQALRLVSEIEARGRREHSDAAAQRSVIAA